MLVPRRQHPLPNNRPIRPIRPTSTVGVLRPTSTVGALLPTINYRHRLPPNNRPIHPTSTVGVLRPTSSSRLLLPDESLVPILVALLLPSTARIPRGRDTNRGLLEHPKGIIILRRKQRVLFLHFFKRC